MASDDGICANAATCKARTRVDKSVEARRRAAAWVALVGALSVTVLVPSILILSHHPGAQAQAPEAETAAKSRRAPAAYLSPPSAPPDDGMQKAKDLLQLLTPFVLLAAVWGSHSANQRNTKEFVLSLSARHDELAGKVDDLRDRNERVGKDIAFIQAHVGASRKPMGDESRP